VRRRGFFPRGQGEVFLTVKSLPRGATLPPIALQRSAKEKEAISVEVSAFSAGEAVPQEAAEAAAEACVRSLLDSGAVTSREQVSVSVLRLRTPEEAVGDGGGVIAVAKVKKAGGGGEGEGGEESEVLLLGSAQPLSPPPKNKKQRTETTRKTTTTAASSSSYSPAPSTPAEVGAGVGADLARDLLSSSPSSSEGGSGRAAATDRWLQDQLVIFMALAKGKSRVETCAPLTEHTRSAIAVAEALTSARFRVVEESGSESRSGGVCVIECEGAGVEAR
jgi:RNA 3'-terminal phosphate cyclase